MTAHVRHSLHGHFPRERFCQQQPTRFAPDPAKVRPWFRRLV